VGVAVLRLDSTRPGGLGGNTGLSFLTLDLRPIDEKNPPPEDLLPGKGRSDLEGDGIMVEERTGLRVCCACASDG